MRFVNPANEGLIYPEHSITGDTADEYLDTGWDVHFEGPAHVYLSDRDLVDIAVPALERDAVVAALKTNGWTPPGETADTVAELEARLAETADALTEAKIVQAGFDAALAKLDAKTRPVKAKS